MKRVNSDLAYELIRKKILSGEYSPGQRLQTQALSAETKVSRTPVREALHKLEADGLVSLNPHSGASVKSMDIEEFRQISEIRLALESHVAGLAAKHRNQTDLQAIKLALEKIRESAENVIRAADETPCLEDFRRADVRFHIGIMTAAKNDLMKREILRLHTVNRIVIGAFDSDIPETLQDDLAANQNEVIAIHQEIYDAILAHDEGLAKHLVGRHVQGAICKFLRLLNDPSGRFPKHLSEEDGLEWMSPVYCRSESVCEPGARDLDLPLGAISEVFTHA